MKNLKIAAAVGAAMMMSSGAFALDQAATAAAPIQLVVAGASAARDAFLNEFNSLCQGTTINVYRATPTTNQDFRAYSCTLLAGTPVPAALQGVNATVYYRSEGGSAWGPGSIAKGTQIKRLLVDDTCTLGATGITSFGGCGVTDYAIATDTGNGHLVSATTDLGVSDVEAPMFRGENWPANALGGEPGTGVLEGLTRTLGFGQAFGVAVNATGITFDSISKADVASIFKGNFTNWNQVQNQATGAAGPNLPITVCRRERGSGTQAAAAIYFLQQNCGKSSESFVTQTAPNPGGYQVITPDTTTALEACIHNNPGAIGPNIFKTTPITDAGNVKYLQIDGVAPGKVNAARGTYSFWFESSFAKRPGLTGSADTLATLLQNRARLVAGIIPTSASAFALPTSTNTPILPVNAAVPSTPVGIGFRNGNSCRVPLGQL